MPPNDILIITRNFPPLVGGMERLMAHAVSELARQYNCTLIGPAECGEHAAAGVTATGCRVWPAPVFLCQATLKALSYALKRKYRFSLAGSGLTAPMAGMAGILGNFPSASFIHGLDLVVENAVYQTLFMPWLRRLDLVIANSRNTARLAVDKGIDPKKIRILHPGVTLPSTPVHGCDEFRERHHLAGKKVLLSVGRLVPRKGLDEFLRHSFPAIVTAIPETVLLVVGSEPGTALKGARGTKQGITEVIEDMGLAGHIKLLGQVDEFTLDQAFCAADLFIFPVRHVPGDVEGFGMVALEAAAHGLPTLAFAEGGVVDAVSAGESGYLVESGDYGKFAEIAIDHLGQTPTAVTSDSCRQFARQFEWRRYGEKLLEILADLSAT